MCARRPHGRPSKHIRRYRVFKYIIDYAAEANLFDQVMPYLEYLDAWMADWETYKHLSPEDKRTLFLDLSRYVRAIGKRLDSFQLLKRYHQLFQVDGADLKDHDEDATAQLLIDAIQIPSVIQFDDILSYDTVKAKTAQRPLHASGLAKCSNTCLGGRLGGAPRCVGQTRKSGGAVKGVARS